MAAVLLLFFLLSAVAAQLDGETTALLEFKSGLSGGGNTALSSWSNSSSHPCGGGSSEEWPGIVCYANHIAAIHLSGMQLSGDINVVAEALSKLPGLRVLMLRHNNLSGELSGAFSGLIGLRALYLSNNKLSGEIPTAVFAAMPRLKKLYLEGNNFSGELPSSLEAAKYLIELRLEGNNFAGKLLDFASGESLRSFNVSGNKLTGEVPKSLSKFDASAFAGNDLCGPPVTVQCQPEPQKPVATAMVAVPPPPVASPPPSKAKAMWSIVGIICVSLTVMAVGVMVKRRRQAAGGPTATLGRHNGGADYSTGKRGLASGSVQGQRAASMRGAAPKKQHKQGGEEGNGSVAASESGGGRGIGAAELVMVNEEKGVIRLNDLMKAAAEVVGAGGLGSAYKAVMASGTAVVVKRMRDMNRLNRESFDVEMRRLGRLRHPNILPPLAYHYRKDEKLLINEFVPKRSLLHILHMDNRGPDNAALMWTTRLKIIREIVAGMAHLHAELDSYDVPHGNLKSSNVLLGADFSPLLVDYGFVPMVNPSQASATLFAYRSPEALAHRHVSPKSDVYCLGIVILEILTGKFPSQYLNSKGGTDIAHWVTAAVNDGRDLVELVDPAIVNGARWAAPHMDKLLRIAVACVETELEHRLSMKQAAIEVEEAAAEADRAAPAVAASAPSLKDGCAAAAYSGNGSSRHLSSGSNRTPSRRTDDAFAFAIS